jgi:hypothetical protein
MQRHEFPIIAFAALLGLTASAHADPSDYGKVDTFQPGKKYNCVPTADHKGWDCNVAGKAEAAPARAETPATPAPAPSHEAPPAESPPPAQATPQAGALPGYLNNPAARDAMQPMPAAPAPKPAPPPRVKGPQVPEQVPAASAANPPPAPPQPVAAPQPAATEPSPAAAPEPAPTPKPAPAVTAPPARVGDDFLALPATQYVIELAHADSAAGLDAARAAAPPAHGEVYELHLSQNGSESWLRLWGPFADLQAARAARDEIAAQGATPGWPRRIGPLQTEARRGTSE